MCYKVLVVDDAIYVRMMICQVLVCLGYTNILEAKNGFEAIELYKENMPALTIMDLTMPELDGLSALKEIISFDPMAKVIMCSAVSHETIIRRAIDLGAIYFITKPFCLNEFEKIITQYLLSKQDDMPT